MRAVLDEIVPFLDGEPLEPGQNEAFNLPGIAAAPASLYEHCARALDVSLSLGEHGLPLIGTGDWNDGMNRVGAQGRGESVWLGWFLLATHRGIRAARPKHATTTRALRAGDNAPGQSARHWKQRAGTASGIGAAITTTARRWARTKAPNARSTRSRSRGA